MQAATNETMIEELWSAAGRRAGEVPSIDFSSELVVQFSFDDHGCPSTRADFQRGPQSVRALVVEPASCPERATSPIRRSLVYAIPWKEAGRPFTLDVVLPEDPDASGSIPID